MWGEEGRCGEREVVDVKEVKEMREMMEQKVVIRCTRRSQECQVIQLYSPTSSHRPPIFVVAPPLCPIISLSQCPLMCILCLNDAPLQTFVGDVDVWSTSQQVTGRYSHKEGVFMCVCMVIQYAVILWCTRVL